MSLQSISSLFGLTGRFAANSGYRVAFYRFLTRCGLYAIQQLKISYLFTWPRKALEIFPFCAYFVLCGPLKTDYPRSVGHIMTFLGYKVNSYVLTHADPTLNDLVRDTGLPTFADMPHFGTPLGTHGFDLPPFP